MTEPNQNAAKLQEYLKLTQRAKAIIFDAEKIREEITNEMNHTEEGQKTHDFGELTLTLKGEMSRTLNEEEWKGVRDEIPDDLHPVIYELKISPRELFKLIEIVPDLASRLISRKISLDVPAYKKLCEDQPAVWKKVAMCVTEKPKKIGFTVKQKPKTEGEDNGL